MPPEYPNETIGSRLLLANGEILSAAEAIVGLAKEPLLLYEPPDPDSPELFAATQWAHVSAILRTGAHFVFSSQDVQPELVHDLIDPKREALPPLPFSRMWLEIDEDPDFKFARIVDLDGKDSLFLGFGVVEVTPCAKWTIYMVMIDREEGLRVQDQLDRILLDDMLRRATAIRTYTLEVLKGRVNVVFSHDDMALLEKQDEWIQKWWYRWQFGAPEFMVQLLHLLGAVHAPMGIPRARRREMQRRFGLDHPSVYWVRLGATTDAHPGSGDRMFFHRWLVRGHYRLAPNGDHVVPGKGVCTWVRPYIKGPDGAPWKGRPVYLADAVA